MIILAYMAELQSKMQDAFKLQYIRTITNNRYNSLIIINTEVKGKQMDAPGILIFLCSWYI